MRIRKLTPLVKKHLEESVEARNSDNVLYLRVLRECISCKHFFECKGKPKGALCINYESRKGEENGGKKNVCKNDN